MRKTIEVVLPSLLTGILVFVASPFLQGMWDYAAKTVLPELSPQARLSLLATLATFCLLEGACNQFNGYASALLMTAAIPQLGRAACCSGYF
jgi:hypothetical protein